MMFTNCTDEQVKDALHLHFGIIVGITQPTVKAKAPSKKPETVIPFSEFSFINVMAFRQAFFEAEKRGIISQAEIAAGREVIAITG